MPSSKTSVDKRDVYYRKGKSEGYRARSAYKLLHLDEEFDLFRGVHTAVDLCAAPGSWSQVLGQKLKPGKGEGDARVVSVDLQAMAPLNNITILQTDITLPSTIPLVLNALGGRKADLVVCDGAPDVTGVHDLDAYLHSQLILAALTLSLTLLAPHSTLIFKIFLSPLDPTFALLRSQLRSFFPGPSDFGTVPDEGDAGFEEFDDVSQKSQGDSQEDEGEAEESRSIRGEKGFDLEGRRGGVWVRKPRSSRAGSGEAFIVCRNFDPDKVPLPSTFSPSALEELAKQTTGTLTLESLAHLGEDQRILGVSKLEQWGRIKAYVGSGSLDSGLKSTPRISLGIKTEGIVRSPRLDQSPTEIESQPTPVEAPSQILISHAGPSNVISYDSPTQYSNTESSTYLSPSKLHLSANSRYSNATRRAAAWAAATSSLTKPTHSDHTRQTSTESLSPPSSASPTSTTFHAHSETRPWDRSAGPPSPLPSPIYLHPSGSNQSGQQDGFPDFIAPLSDGAVSPALSTGSKTDLFFATSQKISLPVPPKPLPNPTTLGRGLPGGLKTPDRSATSPFPHPPQGGISYTPRSDSLFASSISSPARPFVASLQKSGNRSVSTPTEDLSALEKDSNSIFAIPQIPLGSLSTLPTNPTISPSSSLNLIPPPKELVSQRERRESKSLLREHRESRSEHTTLKPGDLVSAEAEGLDEYDVKSHDRTTWRLERVLGEGAFSAVWSAVQIPPSEEKITDTQLNSTKSRVAAIKTMDKRLCAQNSRTRISFIREVEVLKHISHPSIVTYLSSFSTVTHHCLVLEPLDGGELFELVSDERNRQRMFLPCEGRAEGEVVDIEGYGFVRRIFGEICKAVGWLHEVGVVHRDIKLENLLFTINPFNLPPTSSNSIPLHLLPPPPKPLLKLTDFGLSRFISPEDPLLQTRCGSESFAAPEIIMGRPYDGRQTDCWAVGVVLYALVAGELPFDEGSPIAEHEAEIRQRSGSVGSVSSTSRGGGVGDGGERRRTMMRIAKGEFTWREGIASEDLRELVKKLLVRDPKKRLKISEVWDEKWMVGPGSVGRPMEGYSPSHSPHFEGGEVGGGVKKRRILDGFLVDGEMISEVARAES